MVKINVLSIIGLTKTIIAICNEISTTEKNLKKTNGGSIIGIKFYPGYMLHKIGKLHATIGPMQHMEHYSDHDSPIQHHLIRSCF